MKRMTLVLVGLGLVLVVAAWYMLLFTPKNEALADVETQIADVQSQQETTRTRIVALQGVREQAPQLQAELAAAESLLPRETALPSALRQLQQAADQANATLMSVSPARPVQVEGANEGLFAMGLSVELRGSYFQIVDVLRMIEDPAISPRGTVWTTAAISRVEAEGQNVLSVVLSGQMYAVLPSPPAEDTGTGEPAEGTADAEVDVEVDADAGTEEDQ